jgi:hypothetical protein
MKTDAPPKAPTRAEPDADPALDTSRVAVAAKIGAVAPAGSCTGKAGPRPHRERRARR